MGGMMYPIPTEITHKRERSRESVSRDLSLLWVTSFFSHPVKIKKRPGGLLKMSVQLISGSYPITLV